jgi:hypothetical protein
LLKHTKDTYDRLKETSPLLPPEAIADFKRRFDKPEYSDISKPSEANGIEKIVVFNQADMERRMSEMVVMRLPRASPVLGASAAAPSALPPVMELANETDAPERP